MLRPDYPILTDRLRLRPLDVEDAVALHAYQSREDVCRFIPYQPRSLDEVRARLTSPQLNRSTLDQPGQALLLAAVRGDGVLIGDVMLSWISRQHRTGEIGYVIDPAHQGNGYASEAAAALLRLGFSTLDLHRIIARVDARNDASIGVLRHIGMRQEAHLVQNEWFKGEWTDELNFALLADEWRAVEAGREDSQERQERQERQGR